MTQQKDTFFTRFRRKVDNFARIVREKVAVQKVETQKRFEEEKADPQAIGPGHHWRGKINRNLMKYRAYRKIRNKMAAASRRKNRGK